MSKLPSDRRNFIKHVTLAAGFASVPILGHAVPAKQKKLFEISLAQWSLHRRIKSGKLDPLDFARYTKNTFDIHAIEYVNQFYADTLSDKLVKELHTRATGEGVKSLLIMCDNEGSLGDPDKKARAKAASNHRRWADAAHALGCHSIRVNAHSAGSRTEQMQYVADGLNQLADYCDKIQINVIVENHGGLSSDGQWLSEVMKLVNRPRVGTLPDFGNFVIDRETGKRYDKYKGVKELLPWAKALSAKGYSFNGKGEEREIDFYRMMKMSVQAGYSGYVGIEYEGENSDEVQGIIKIKTLLESVHSKLA
ncbi:MAG: sugar phosphate isomerase/epimerase [Cellvibrionaceae bacterium]|nr:sugar phosphate isomerase/epimerase [Cellvibrionaceae bacterium]